jgi:hypothetical protein
MNLGVTASEFWPPEPPKGKYGYETSRHFSRIDVRGKHSPNGIFLHPSPKELGLASVSFDLGRQYQTFCGDVTLNDTSVRSPSPVTFTVFGDGRILWKSDPILSQEESQTCSVSVKGVKILKLQVAVTHEHRGAHAVWVEPYLIKNESRQ